ncbi:hypothetical protein PILCRDRAFT_1954 [Piloderma croceum F 1598]|uniref:Uncharacterized protein n=1 Tax=Piloderma croceum (strain F 1598) TaxID=765440 RepID=A0A0C3GD58_PILCF|nr:hypothetical protein PILCRDRAFT_1954 [Piloderma croceum F 1598]
MNLTITKKFKKKWRGNIILVETGAQNRNHIEHTKKGDLTDMVVGMWMEQFFNKNKDMRFGGNIEQ